MTLRIVSLLLAIAAAGCSESPKAVYEAVAEGDLARVERLLERGAPLDWAPESGFGALHKALHDGRSDIAAVLIEHGADVNARGVYGITPLHIAEDPSLTALLLSKDAHTEAWSDTLGTPLNAAVLSGLADVAEVLLAAGAQIDARDVHGSTPLHHAAGRGDLILTRVLVSKGADVNAANEPGFRPLHWAAGNGHAAVVKVLLAGGARPNVVGANGRTPMDMAKVGGHEAVMALLRAAR